jgi:sortase A
LKRTTIIILAVIVFLAAMGFTAYPIISSKVNAKYASEIQTTYEEVLQEADNSDLLEAKEKAIAYNDSITPGASVEDAYSQEALINATRDYEGLLNIANDGIMGYLKIPKIGVQLPIYHGTDNDSLERGIGHLLGSSLPVGGDSTHTILTAHSGMASQKMFSDLPQLEVGDVFYLRILGETLAYQVDQINTVLPHDTTFLGIEQGEDLATLVTCTPFGVNTHRLLVRGERIPYEEAEVIVETTQEEVVESTWEQHYLKGIIVGLAIVLVIVLIAMVARFVWRAYHESR